MTKFPPLPTDFQEYQMTVTKVFSQQGNNSICAAMGSPTQAARGMTFIAQSSEAVNASTLEFAGAIGLLATASAVTASALLLLTF